MSGQATVEIDGREEILQPEQGVEVAPGVAHQVFNNGSKELRFIVVSCPASHNDRINV